MILSFRFTLCPARLLPTAEDQLCRGSVPFLSVERFRGYPFFRSRRDARKIPMPTSENATVAGYGPASHLDAQYNARLLVTIHPMLTNLSHTAVTYSAYTYS